MSADWPKVRLGDILKLVSRPVMVDPNETYRILGAHWYAQGLYTKEVKDGSQIRAKTLYRVEEGDFVYNRLFAWKGSFAIATDENHGCYASNEFPCFSIDRERIDGQYLWRYFSRASAWNEALGLSTGGTPTSRNRLKENKFLAMKIPLPPLNVQRRIMARIEELAAKIEEAQKLRRQAAEEAEMLLNSKLNSIFKRSVQENGLSKLDDLIVKAGYGTSTKCQYETVENSVPVLRIPNIASEKIDFNDMKYGVLGDKELTKVLVSEDDLLVVRTNGSADLVGRCAVISELLGPTAFASYLIRIRCDPNVIYPYYLQLMLKYLRTEGKLFNFARTTAGQYNVSLGRLRGAEIPVPPIDEQRRIVAHLDEIQAKVDALKKYQARTADEMDALLPSVLDRAFKGDL